MDARARIFDLGGVSCRNRGECVGLGDQLLDWKRHEWGHLQQVDSGGAGKIGAGEDPLFPVGCACVVARVGSGDRRSVDDCGGIVSIAVFRVFSVCADGEVVSVCSAIGCVAIYKLSSSIKNRNSSGLETKLPEKRVNGGCTAPVHPFFGLISWLSS